MDVRHLSRTSLIALAWIAVAAAVALADSGATLTPDRLTYMVNKDLGNERWTINLNLTPDAPQTFLNASGNIFRTDGAAPQFVLCQVRPDSTGTLDDPSSVFRFSCTGSGPCQGAALDCSRTEWQPISSDVSVEAKFFLPPGGRGSTETASDVRIASAPSTAAGNASRGSTLSSDGFSFLVNKDVGAAERWSISLNLVPARTSEGTLKTGFSSVTGNVFKSDGAPPSFIYCTQRPDSHGTIADAKSLFLLTCLGTGACTTTANECATSKWQPLGEIDLPASFFLPPEGLPDSTSPPEIFVIGRTSDPPSIVSPEYRLVGSGSAAGDRPLGSSCPIGQACVVPRLGSCTDTPGVVVSVDFCGCKVTDIPSACITCGSGASGTCGGVCDYPVGTGDLAARGFCLPFAQGTSDCLCYAVPDSGEPTAPACGGTVGASCPGDRCCADDPRDGCTDSGGGIDCAGICVDAGGCDPQTQQCGICPTPTPTPTACGNNRREGSEACDGTDLDGKTCASQVPGSAGQLACAADCKGFDVSDCRIIDPCGNGTIDPPEQCDGTDVGDDSCQARGFCGGELSCTDQCQIDQSSCVASGGLPDGASCASSACCASGICSGTVNAPDTRRCIPCPKLFDECSDAACCDPFNQLECQAAAGRSFCCIRSGSACDGDGDCCSGSCQAGVCQ